MIRVTGTSSTPIYRQIVDQIRYMIEIGELTRGERLPSARVLADNIHINRNTVTKAYSILRDMGLIVTQGASGTIVTGTALNQDERAKRGSAREILGASVDKCLALGISAEEIGSIALHTALQASNSGLNVAFVECNEERAAEFAKELTERLKVPVQPSLLSELDSVFETSDLLITTFFHLAEVRRLVHRAGLERETIAVVARPHIQTLVKIAALPSEAQIAVRYSTEHQALQIRDWLSEVCSHDVTVITDDDELTADLDVLLVPSESPELGANAAPNTAIIEFGNVLDEGSISVISETLDDVRVRKNTLMRARNE